MVEAGVSRSCGEEELSVSSVYSCTVSATDYKGLVDVQNSCGYGCVI